MQDLRFLKNALPDLVEQVHPEAPITNFEYGLFKAGLTHTKYYDRHNILYCEKMKRHIKESSLLVLLKKEKAGLYKKQNYSCADCKQETQCDELEIDHIRALINGGEFIEDNLQLLCYSCHKKKTAFDLKIKSERNKFLCRLLNKK